METSFFLSLFFGPCQLRGNWKLLYVITNEGWLGLCNYLLSTLLINF